MRVFLSPLAAVSGNSSWSGSWSYGFWVGVNKETGECLFGTKAGITWDMSYD